MEDDGPEIIGKRDDPDRILPDDGVQLIWEKVNVAVVKRMCALDATRGVTISAPGGRMSLRRALYSIVVRENAAGGKGVIPVLVAENVDFQEFNHGRGRRYSGVHELPGDLPKSASSAIARAVAAGLRTFEATCSAFAYARVLKSLVRCGLACHDCDINGAAPRAVVSRHESEFMNDFMARREQLYQQASSDRAASKELYHSVLYGSVSGGKADVRFKAATGEPVPKHVEAM